MKDLGTHIKKFEKIVKLLVAFATKAEISDKDVADSIAEVDKITIKDTELRDWAKKIEFAPHEGKKRARRGDAYIKIEPITAA